MIRIRLKQLLDDKAFSDKRRISFVELADATGVSAPTLRRIANVPGYNAELDAINALCGYFCCQPGDLLEYVFEAAPGPTGEGG